MNNLWFRGRQILAQYSCKCSYVRTLSHIVLLYILGICLPVYGGELFLVNGDRIEGTLIQVEAHEVVWQSSMLGELRVAKTQIAKVSIVAPIKVPGRKKPCKWVSIKDEDVVLACKDRGRESLPWLTLKGVVPYKAFSESGIQYGGKLLVQGSQARGNIESSDWLLNNSVYLNYGHITHGLNMTYTSRFVASDPNAAADPPTIEQYIASYRLGWQVLPRWFVFSDIAGTKDDAKSIDSRYEFGLGFGYKFWETEKSSYSLETGLQHTRENLTYDPLSERFDSWRVASLYRYRFSSDISLVQENKFLQSLNHRQDWEASSSTSLSMPIFLGIYADFTLRYDYDNTPTGSEDLIEDDIVFRVGLGYEW